MKCKACRQPFEPRNSMQKACSLDCAIALVDKQKAKSAAKLAREERRERAVALAKIKPRAKLIAEAQAACNRYVRLRDANERCISCDGGISGATWQAGHYRSTGAAPALRFNLDNIHRQCVRCNMHLSGNLINYRIGLLKRIGPERLAALEGPHDPAKWTRDELIEMRAEFTRMARQLEKE